VDSGNHNAAGLGMRDELEVATVLVECRIGPLERSCYRRRRIVQGASEFHVGVVAHPVLLRGRALVGARESRVWMVAETWQYDCKPGQVTSVCWSSSFRRTQ
jgi:hypothetical protein